MRILAFGLTLSVWTVALPSCGDDADTKTHKETYFVVTHGPTTDVGFWGDVFAGGEESAKSLGVQLTPLHPAVEGSGSELNAQMQQAIDAMPAGIIATIWGDGMDAVVKKANAAGIPVAAINVYPDSAKFAALNADGTAPAGKAGFLLYAGQNDSTAAVDVANALVCKAAKNEGFAAGNCSGGGTPAQAWATLTGTIKAACILHQQSAGVVSRCEEMRSVMTNLGLATTDYADIVWTESVPGAAKTAIEQYFADAEITAADHIIVMANGNGGIDPYHAATIEAAVKAKVTLGTFDTGETICAIVGTSELAFASGQGHRDQAKSALSYLHHYVHNNKTLPAMGKSTSGAPETAWTTAPEGFPWYKTGPQFLTHCD